MGSQGHSRAINLSRGAALNRAFSFSDSQSQLTDIEPIEVPAVNGDGVTLGYTQAGRPIDGDTRDVRLLILRDV
jgi:hypothetical protein